eukprot:jgi/Psemu1/4838/gm1.4838_g
MPTPFDWTPIFGIEFQFTSASNPSAAASLNKVYSEIIGTNELSEFFVTRKEEGPLEIAPDPQLHILNCIAKAIGINLIDPNAVTQDHIANLLNKCVIKHVRNDGSRKRMRYKTEFDAAAKHAIRTNTDGEPIVLFELTITHWRFKTKWRPDLFMQAYTGDPSSATASRAQFANLLQRKYTTPKAAPPDAPILAPITPAEQAKNVNATIPSETTKMVASNAAATPVEALSATQAPFRWTFTPQHDIATFRRLPKSAPSPSPPSGTLGEVTDLPNATPAYIQSLQTPCCNLLCPKPKYQPVLRLSKRHRDALIVKLYHLYANILSMNCCFTPPNYLPRRHRDAITIKLYQLHATLLIANWFYDDVT